MVLQICFSFISRNLPDITQTKQVCIYYKFHFFYRVSMSFDQYYSSDNGIKLQYLFRWFEGFNEAKDQVESSFQPKNQVGCCRLISQSWYLIFVSKIQFLEKKFTLDCLHSSDNGIFGVYYQYLISNEWLNTPAAMLWSQNVWQYCL